jgi:hypothetical protein
VLSGIKIGKKDPKKKHFRKRKRDREKGKEKKVPNRKEKEREKSKRRIGKKGQTCHLQSAILDHYILV